MPRKIAGKGRTKLKSIMAREGPYENKQTTCKSLTFRTVWRVQEKFLDEVNEIPRTIQDVSRRIS